MAKKAQAYLDSHTANLKKTGKPRRAKIFRKKGNAPARTSKRGNGKKLR